MAPIGSIDYSKYLLQNGRNIAGVNTVPSRQVSGPGTESRVLNPEAFKGVVSEAVSRRGVEPTREAEAVAGAQTVAALPRENLQPVDASFAKQVFSAQPSLKSADAYRGVAAENAYAKFGKNSYDTSQYDALKSFKSSEVSKINPFAAAFANNGGNYTSGLSFGGVKNLNPEQSMFIA